MISKNQKKFQDYIKATGADDCSTTKSKSSALPSGHNARVSSDPSNLDKVFIIDRRDLDVVEEAQSDLLDGADND